MMAKALSITIQAKRKAFFTPTFYICKLLVVARIVNVSRAADFMARNLFEYKVVK